MAVIRRAGSGDVDLLAQVRRAWATEDDGDIDDGGAFEDAFAAWWAAERDRRVTWLAFVGDEPVGMLNVAEFVRMPKPGRLHGRWGYLSNLFVLAEHRNAGLGTRMLDLAVAEARERGYARLVLHPSERAVPLYRRAGFRRADELLILPL